METSVIAATAKVNGVLAFETNIPVGADTVLKVFAMGHVHVCHLRTKVVEKRKVLHALAALAAILTLKCAVLVVFAVVFDILLVVMELANRCRERKNQRLVIR